MRTWKRACLLLVLLWLASMGADTARSQPAGEIRPAVAGEEDTPAPTRAAARGSVARAALAARIEALVAGHTALAASRVGIFAQDLDTGVVLYERAAREPYSVASVTKVITMAAALAYLGPDFRFRTALRAEAVDDRGVVAGDLYLEARGNPMLTAADLDQLARWLRRAGITRVRGDLVVDAGYFDGEDSPPHFDEQPEEQAAFRAPVGAASLERSAFTVLVRAARAPGRRAEVWIEPETPYLRPGRFEVVTQRSGRDLLRVDSRVEGDRMIVDVTGQVRAGADVMRVRRRVAAPAAYTGETLRAALKAQGIRIRAPARLGTVPPGAQTLAYVDSEPLSVLVRQLGKSSDNFVAETLLKTLAAEHRDAAAGDAPATWQQGLDVVRRFLIEEAGLPPDSFRYGNGSGLFDASAFSPAQIGAVLAAAHRDMRYGPDLMSALAIAGTDGTLRRRLVSSPARGRVRAKTGTLAAVSTLAGYLDAGGSAPVAFAVFVNDIEPRWIARRAARELQDRVVETVLEHLAAIHTAGHGAPGPRLHGGP